VKLNKQGVRDLSTMTVGLVVPANGPSSKPEPIEIRIENPDHDSLFARFEQLEGLLDDTQDDYDYRDALGEARALLKLIRAQVLR